MGELNVNNRTLAVMDNLLFLRSLNNECIDLIAIDPPFAANETFTQSPKPPITQSELAEEKALAAAHGVEHSEGIGETRVKDVWNWDEDIHPAWKMQIEDDYPAVHAVIQAVEACATENEAAYIAFMAVRLIECRRVLKPTGSIYVHCDSHADSYLRMLLDAVFGNQNFRSEITWKRTTNHNDVRRNYSAIGDIILFYTKSADFTFQTPYMPYSQEHIKNSYRYVDEDDRKHSRRDLRSPHPRPNLTYDYKGYKPHPNGWSVSLERMKQLDAEGRLHFPKKKSGRIRLKRFLDEMPGVPAGNIWDDIKPIGAQARERTGYSTQKPLELYERIIKASSNPNDVVLDIFAGCATTAVAAENLGRQWIACDMAYRSWTMLKRRFYQNGFALTDMTDSTREALGEHQIELQEAESSTIGFNELPKRSDIDPAPFHSLAQTRRGKRSTQSASWSGRIPKDEAKRLLINRFGPVCWGCGYEPLRPNGSIDDMLLEVDHIRAKRASEGAQGDDELYNLALLHRTCNGIKRNKLTLEELRTDNADNGRLYVSTTGELVDLFEAQQFAVAEIMKRGVQEPLSTHTL